MILRKGRRLNLKVKFELPDESLRKKIWESHVPKDRKIADNVNFEILARKYEFSGGYIKNAMQNALRKIAVRKNDTLLMEDLIFGAEMEKEGMFTSNHKKNNPIGFKQL